MRYYIVTINLLEANHEGLIAITPEGHQLGIPKDPENLDYQNYLAWVSEGNTAEEWRPEP
jgi:hypothetical protein